MPTNLPPKYFDVEKKYKSATDPTEKIALVEEMLAIIPKHKGTEKLRAMYKSKITKFRDAAQKKSATARHGDSHNIRKSGAGQVVVLGAPNTGKSMLIKALTGIDLHVGDYPFTTFEAAPAMMKYKGIQIQLVDTPPISKEFMEIWHPDLVKSADMVMVVVDPSGPDPVDSLQILLEKLEAKKIHFVRDHLPEPDEREPGWSYKKLLLTANKSDLPDAADNLEIVKELAESEFEWFPVSALSGDRLEDLKERIYQILEIIRVYSKIPGKKTEYKDPYTLPIGSTVLDAAKVVHKDFYEDLAFARIWGKSTYDGQRVNRCHVLEDEDVLELHKS